MSNQIDMTTIHPKESTEEPCVGQLWTQGGLTWSWTLDSTSIMDTSGKALQVVSIRSPRFVIETDDGQELVWQLGMDYHDDLSRISAYSRGFHIRLISLNTTEVSVEFELRAERAEYFHTPLYHSKLVRKSFSSLGNSLFCSVWINGNPFIDEIRGRKTFGYLKIICHFSCPIHERCCKDCKLSHDILWKLVQEENFGDVEFHVNGKIFRAHQTLLSNQSKVFAEDFSKSEGGDKKIIVIPDIDDGVFIEILRYVYFKEVQRIDKYGKGLFAAAAKYSMISLRDVCEKTMNKNLAPENAIAYLELADLHGLKELKEQIIELIISNFKTIITKSSFELLKKMNSGLLCELIQAMGAKLP